MAVAFVSKVEATPVTTGAATTLTIPSVVGSGGNLVVAIFGWRDAGGETMSGATYNGVAMTHVGSADSGASGARVDAWYFNSPGGTANVVGTWTGAPQRIHGHALVFSGADVAGTSVGTASAENSTGASATVDRTVTTIVDGMVVDGLYVRNDENFTADAGQTERSRSTVAATDAFECSTEPATTTSTTTGWTWSSAAGMAYTAVPIHPATGGGGGTAVPVFTANLRRQGIL
jgi:hypothetical protein